MGKFESYSDEFKKEALRLLESTGKAKTTIEKELGITPGLLGRWQKRFRINEATDELELGKVELLKAEVRRLKREAEMRRQEGDILKKQLRYSRRTLSETL